MLHGTQVTGYVVEFFQSGKQGAVPNDMVYLKGETVSDAVSQAKWLARRTFHNHFQIRAVADGARPVIYTSSPLTGGREISERAFAQHP